MFLEDEPLLILSFLELLNTWMEKTPFTLVMATARGDNDERRGCVMTSVKRRSGGVGGGISSWWALGVEIQVWLWRSIFIQGRFKMRSPTSYFGNSSITVATIIGRGTSFYGPHLLLGETNVVRFPAIEVPSSLFFFWQSLNKTRAVSVLDLQVALNFCAS